MSIFRGSGVAIVTPFKNDEIDYEGFEKLLKYQLDNGTDAIIVCGTTGESSTLSDEEKIELIKFAVNKVNKKVPVIAGTGGNNTKKVIELSKKAEEVGADALLIVTPYYNKTTQNGLYEHYKAIAGSVKLPIIVYNVPSRTGLNVKPETVKKLNEISNIIAIKEASGDLVQISEIASICDIDIYSGSDELNVPILSVGGIGAISVLANVLPRETHDMIDSYLKGDTDKSKELQLKLFKLIRLLFCEVNPIPVKAGVKYLGICDDEVRLPLVRISDSNRTLLEDELKKYL